MCDFLFGIYLTHRKNLSNIVEAPLKNIMLVDKFHRLKARSIANYTFTNFCLFIIYTFKKHMKWGKSEAKQVDFGIANAATPGEAKDKNLMKQAAQAALAILEFASVLQQGQEK